MSTADALPPKTFPKTDQKLKLLTPEQIIRIDELLAAVGEYGEVHLIVQRGELRYMNKVESYKAWLPDEKAGQGRKV